MENKYYIYLHIRLDNGQPFYVGKGKNNRAFDKRGRNLYWKKIVNKNDYDVIFIEENLSEKKSYELEKYWIKRIGRRNLGLGPLANLTDGGDGGDTFSKHPNREIRIKNLSNKMFGKNNHFYGRKHSEDSKNLMSKSSKKYRPTEKTKELIKKNNKKSLIVLDEINGIFYNSIKEAAEYLGYKRKYLYYHLTKNKIKHNLRIV